MLEIWFRNKLKHKSKSGAEGAAFGFIIFAKYHFLL